MTNSKGEGALKKYFSLGIYLLGLGMQIYSLFLFYLFPDIPMKPLFITSLYTFFGLYVVLGILLIIRLFAKKTKKLTIFMAIFLCAILILSFPLTNKMTPGANMRLYKNGVVKGTSINYLFRDYFITSRWQRDGEAFLNGYLGDKNVHMMDTDNIMFSSERNLFILNESNYFNIIVDNNKSLNVDAELAASIGQSGDYYNFIFYANNNEYIYVYTYIGEELQSTNDIMICRGEEERVYYFIPKAIWEELNEK